MDDADFERIPATESCLERPAQNPHVSVLMLAHQHADYIDEAIESVVMQHCDFPVELLIGEDSSSDKTLMRCRYWQQKFPATIRIVTSQSNVGMHRNFARIWHRARAPLIALCEGDDYWVDVAKLQMQVNWFREHPDCSLLGTLTDRMSIDGNGKWVVTGQTAPLEIKERYDLCDLLKHYSFHFSSVVVRKSSVRFPRWFWDVYCVDRPLYLLAAQNGNAGLLPVVTTHYRQHGGGVWSHRSPKEKASSSTTLFRKLESHLDPAFKNKCKESLAGILWFYMAQAIRIGDRAAARSLFWQSIREHPVALLRAQRLNIPAAGIRVHWPGLYSALRGVTTNSGT